MALFAKIFNGVVEQVIVINDSDMQDENGVIQESIGSIFCSNLSNGGEWKMASTDGSIRFNEAKVGDTYDPVRNAFISQSPYPSWVLNESNMKYEAPVKLEHGKSYDEWTWDESTLSWVERYK
jgi:hypothetical protein